MALDGTLLSFTAQFTGVAKPTVSVPRICKKGNEVSFTPGKACIKMRATCVEIPAKQRGGQYYIVLQVGALTSDEAEALLGEPHGVTQDDGDPPTFSRLERLLR